MQMSYFNCYLQFLNLTTLPKVLIFIALIMCPANLIIFTERKLYLSNEEERLGFGHAQIGEVTISASLMTFDVNCSYVQVQVILIQNLLKGLLSLRSSNKKSKNEIIFSHFSFEGHDTVQGERCVAQMKLQLPVKKGP